VLSVKSRFCDRGWGLWSLCAVASFGSSVEGHLVDALAPRGDEGRGKTAISDGEPYAGVDPSISESGNRHGVMSMWPPAEYIGWG
jgi:hypothetical protein